ncbi:MAG TPA: cation-translocating P-type ATPase [Bryobacteraceae bacterium]|nr:cation-translocating P-type ATPase [Bryobacteraceae bacterium]
MSRSVPERDTSSPDSIPVSRIVETHAAVTATGHEAEHGHEEHAHEHGGLATADAVRIGVAALVALLRLFPFTGYGYVTLAAVILCGYPIYREAFESLRERRMTMELSMTIALLAASVIGEFFTALMIVLFVLIAEVIEGFTVGRGRRAIRELLDLLPKSVEVRVGGGEATVDVSELKAGSIVVVKPGTRIPIDGVVLAGTSFVDEAAITGEPLPVEKLVGSSVYAGAVNQSGSLEIETRAVGHDTAFGRIVEAVECAEHARAPIQKTADRLAGYLVYFALACAALTFLLTRNVRSTISVIIVAGACGIAAGTPLAILGGIGRAAKSGLIIKGGLYLEALWKVTTVVLDKTGTLTSGKPRVTAIGCAPGVNAEQVLSSAAVAESRSEHTIARAILDESIKRQVPIEIPEKFDYTPGRGIAVLHRGQQILVGNRRLLSDNRIDVPSANGTGPAADIFVALDRKWIGTISISDSLRAEAVEAVAQMKGLGLKTILLSGDTEASVQRTTRVVGLDRVISELLPVQKQEEVQRLRQSGEFVAMVGDGINDAPALVAANVGIAMGSGTDIAQESADALLLGNDLLRFVEALKIARRCRAIIFANFFGTLAVDAVGVALAAFGFLTPLLAVSIHVISELAFILNSARLLPSRTK